MPASTILLLEADPAAGAAIADDPDRRRLHASRRPPTPDEALAQAPPSTSS